MPNEELDPLNRISINCDDAVAAADLLVIARTRNVTCHRAVQVIGILRPFGDFAGAEAPIAILHTTVLVIAIGGAIACAHVQRHTVLDPKNFWKHPRLRWLHVACLEGPGTDLGRRLSGCELCVVENREGKASAAVLLVVSWAPHVAFGLVGIECGALKKGFTTVAILPILQAQKRHVLCGTVLNTFLDGHARDITGISTLKCMSSLSFCGATN